MADNLRSKRQPPSSTTGFTETVPAEDMVLGDKATGGLDDDKDHVPNVIAGLKAAISNPNTSEKAKGEAEKKLEAVS